jgi:hypothetical protein
MSKVQESWNVLGATGTKCFRRSERERRPQRTVDGHLTSPAQCKARNRIEDRTLSAMGGRLNRCEQIPSTVARLLPKFDETGAHAGWQPRFCSWNAVDPRHHFEEFAICR